MPAKLSQQLLQRLIFQFPGHIPSKAKVVRIQRGRHGISAGTWAWEVLNAKGVSIGLGSEDTMRACVEAAELESYEARGDFLIVANQNSRNIPKVRES